MSTSTHPHNSAGTLRRDPAHLVHVDSVDDAISLLVDSGIAGELVCDGSCASLASCNLAPVDDVPTAA